MSPQPPIHLERAAMQVRMARAALGLDMRELARRAGLAVNTIYRVENAASGTRTTIKALETAFAEAGVRFVEVDGEVGAMVRVHRGG